MQNNPSFKKNPSKPNTGQAHIHAFRQRIIDILHQKKRTKAWLAGEMGLSKQNLNYLLNHATKLKHIECLAGTLNINPKWLAHGVGPINVCNEHPPHYRHIPLIPWTTPIYNEFENPHTPAPSLIGELNLPPNCFAINLNNRSMEPQFKPGTTLIFDAKRLPQHEDYVLVTLLDDETPLFRQYLTRGNQPSLYASQNNMLRPIDPNTLKIHGILVQARYNYGI